MMTQPFDLRGLREVLTDKRLYGLLSIAGAIVLFGSPGVREDLGLADFLKENRSWVGAVWLFAASACAVKVFGIGWEWTERAIRAARNRFKRRLALRRMARDEAKLLARYYAADAATLFLHADGELPCAEALCRKGILKRCGVAFTIEDWASEEIAANPALILSGLIGLLQDCYEGEPTAFR